MFCYVVFFEGVGRWIGVLNVWLWFNLVWIVLVLGFVCIVFVGVVLCCIVLFKIGLNGGNYYVVNLVFVDIGLDIVVVI